MAPSRMHLTFMAGRRVLLQNCSSEQNRDARQGGDGGQLCGGAKGAKFEFVNPAYIALSFQ